MFLDFFKKKQIIIQTSLSHILLFDVHNICEDVDNPV